MRHLFLTAFAAGAAAQTGCSSTLPFSAGQPTVAKGFTARVFSNDIKSPRGMVADKAGNLLVVSSGTGIFGLKIKENGDCVSVAQNVPVVADSSLNHGIALTPDGKTLFASSRDKVVSWPYDSATMRVGAMTTWLSGMTNMDHSTRTLLIPKSAPNMLLVSRGSAANMDTPTAQITSGRSQIRIFDISSPKQYKYTDGKVLGWGLRNSVGLGENPADGGIWSNENASDSLSRDGVDIHENSPGEEVNFHGFLNNTNNAFMGKNYGYPSCAATWSVKDMPRNTNLRVGRQFSYAAGTGTAAKSDDACADEKQFQPPRITLPSHWAPIDIAFNSKGSVAYMTSRGSWNKRSPDGYQLFAISFDPKTGQPVHPPTSMKAAIPIVTNSNLSKCPSGCFRPTGVTFDPKGRLFMASERTKEIFIVGRDDGKSVDEAVLETQPPPMAMRTIDMWES